ncbi:MAG TPA: helicase-related protein [Chroococcales cyanobacterium]
MILPKKLQESLTNNEQAAAEKDGLVPAGESYQLTKDQEKAILELGGFFEREAGNALLVAPTGSGKTQVLLRIAVCEVMRTRRPVIILVPTRDLARQHLRYFSERLKNTPLYTAEIHGGIAAPVRKELLASFGRGRHHIGVASSLILTDPHWEPLLKGVALLVVDDVNAYDPEDALRRLKALSIPMLFSTATPEPVESFLKVKNVQHLVCMETMPFAAPPTTIHTLKARAGERPTAQVERARKLIEKHIKSEGRIFVISRTRAEVPFLTYALRDAYGIPVAMLHGEMADSRDMAKRLEKFGGKRPPSTRIYMMRRFRDSLPAILVSTNLVGAGLDVPAADLVVVTDADSFGQAELEQLIGRVGRRNRQSDACLIVGATAPKKQLWQKDSNKKSRKKAARTR